MRDSDDYGDRDPQRPAAGDPERWRHGGRDASSRDDPRFGDRARAYLGDDAGTGGGRGGRGESRPDEGRGWQAARDAGGRGGHTGRVNEFGGDDMQRAYEAQGGRSGLGTYGGQAMAGQGGYGGGSGGYGGQGGGYGGYGGSGGRGGWDERGHTGRVNEFGGMQAGYEADRGGSVAGGGAMGGDRGGMGQPSRGGGGYRAGGTDWMGGTMGDYGGAAGDAGGRPWGGAGTRGGRGPKGWTRSDDRIRDDICERLSNMHDIDASEVTVTVHQGHVRLEGTVPDRRMKHRIEDLVDGCPGVQDVDNLVRVSRGGTGVSGVPVGSNSLAGREHMRNFSQMPMSEMGSVEPLVAEDRTDSSAQRTARGGLLSRLFGFDTGAKVRDVMTRDPQVVSPQSTVQQAAALMKQIDVGVVPVCDGQRLQGMVTDRDIALRAVAEGKAPDTTPVSEVMTSRVHWCYEDEDIDKVLDKMGSLQIRRIPVIERDSKRLVGIVSLGDLAVEDRGDVDSALQQISTPAQPERSGAASQQGAMGTSVNKAL